LLPPALSPPSGAIKVGDALSTLALPQVDFSEQETVNVVNVIALAQRCPPRVRLAVLGSLASDEDVKRLDALGVEMLVSNPP
jgi:hypothetical protein